jgi:hypothetical protein
MNEKWLQDSVAILAEERKKGTIKFDSEADFDEVFDEEWITKADNMIKQVRASGGKSFTIEAPKSAIARKLNASIIKGPMGSKIAGEKTKTWKITLAPPKPVSMTVTMTFIKLK